MLIGRLGRDPEKKVFGTNTVVEFSLATTKSWQSNNEWNEKTTWHNLKAWNKTADKVMKYAKGQLVFVEGELEMEEWEKDGQRRSKTVINARQVQLLEKRQQNDAHSHQHHEREPFINTAGDGSDKLPF
jgi:single-strand DNA-binding protein